MLEPPRAVVRSFVFSVVAATLVVVPSVHAAVTHRWPAEGDATDAVGAAGGTLSGGVSFGEGSVGQGLVFDGVDGRVSFGTEAGNVADSDFTISFSIRTTSDVPTSAILNKRETCSFSSFWDIRSSGDGSLSFELYESSTNAGAWTVLPVNDGAFHDVKFVREGTTVSAYVDRVRTLSRDIGVLTNTTNGAELVAGDDVCVGLDSTSPFLGTLDEISISDSADPPTLCGDTILDDSVTATDALATLRTAVGLQTCDVCLCDVNGSGSISAGDALAILRLAVGNLIFTHCPACL